MARFLGSWVALVILIVAAYPFARDAYHRYELSQHLLNPRDQAALRQWNGDPASFARSLLERCELSAQKNGTDLANCEAYRRLASN